MAKDGKTNKHFWKEFKAELKRVIWPTPKQLLNSTIAVLTIVIITAGIVFVLDLTFDLFNNYGINKLKEGIESSRNTAQEQEAADDEAVNDEEQDVVVDESEQDAAQQEENVVE